MRLPSEEPGPWTFTLNYQTAEKLREMLTDEKQSVLSKRGSALADLH